MKTHDNFDERFDFAGKAKTYSLVAILAGLVCIALGFLTGHAEREFANLLLCAYYFAGVTMIGVFFCALQYVAQAGWSASILRVPQAFGKVLPFAAVVLIAVVACGIFLTHDAVTESGEHVMMPYLYKWAVKGITVVGSATYDAKIAGKSGFLNIPFFFIRMVGYLACYSIFGYMLIKYSQSEDETGGMSNYSKSFKLSAAFLVLFGFTTPLYAFDTIMSLEAHWFSTMFGWYNFAAMWVSGLATITLTLIILKENGYMEWVTENHLHSLGQLVFGFSIFWTYTWFAQFLLMYYSNLPEEAVYFYKRWEPEFKPWFWLNIIINFASPLLILMSRDAKRKRQLLKAMCIVLICGHWLDYYMMIMPGTVGPGGRGFSFEEIGTFVGFAGLFSFMMLTALSRFESLIPKRHPFLEESLHHHI